MTAIVVVDRNWGIGKDGKLLARLPGDLAYFKKKTLGNIVVMGRKTLESLPGGKPLDGRFNYVLSHDSDYLEKHRQIMSDYMAGDANEEPKIVSARSIDDLQWKLRLQKRKTIFVIGGASIYSQLLDFVDTCFVTKIDAAFDADAFFPDLDSMADFSLVDTGKTREENGFSYRFTKYERVNSGEANGASQIGFL